MIALIDYGAGNLRSVENALTCLGFPVERVDRPAQLKATSAIVFPGVGAARPAMERLGRDGMVSALVEAIQDGVPYLGICLGLQLLFEWSEEDDAPCLGILGGTVERLRTTEKLPHVGWNSIDVVRRHPLADGLNGETFYFVHSYVVRPVDRADVVAETRHGVAFPSLVIRGNVVGTQFHPERSGANGLRFLEAWVGAIDAPSLTLPRTRGRESSLLARTRGREPSLRGNPEDAAQADHSLP